MSTHPQPQGDVDPSPVYDLGTLRTDVGVDSGIGAFGPADNSCINDGRYMLAAEKRGPAFFDHGIADAQFAATGQPFVENMLVQSLQSQAVKITGETLNALRRCCLLDLVKCWPRLLKVVNVTSLGARAYLRQSWEWQEMREAVELALCYAEQPESLHWQRADALLRGYAMQAAMAIESRLGTEDYDAESLAIVTLNAGAYRAFSEGRM